MNKQEKEITKLFLELVSIDSPSGDEKRMADFLVNELQNLSLYVYRDKQNNIYARNKHFSSKKSILLSAHMDTISSNEGVQPVVKGKTIKSDGKNILGADNKAAIAEIVYTLRNLNGKNSRDFEILFSTGEETGLKGIKTFNFSRIQAKEALVFDYNHVISGIVMKSPTAIIFKVEVIGESGHGSKSNGGINAIEIAAECISKFKFNNKNITFNVGLIGGGSAVNTVPHKVSFSSAVRSYDDKLIERFVSKMKETYQAVATKRGGKIIISEEVVGKSYRHSKNDKFVKEIRDGFHELGYNVFYDKSFGLSDANVLNEKKVKAFDIGYGAKDIHTSKESVEADKMIEVTRFIETMLLG